MIRFDARRKTNSVSDTTVVPGVCFNKFQDWDSANVGFKGRTPVGDRAREFAWNLGT